jgi:hypothetical protein
MLYLIFLFIEYITTYELNIIKEIILQKFIQEIKHLHPK